MKPSKISVRTVKGIRIIDCSEILYCQADGRYTRFFLNNGENYIVAKVLKKYEALLTPNCFLRIHKSYLVNLEFVKEFNLKNERAVILHNNKELQVSKRKCKILVDKVLGLFPPC